MFPSELYILKAIKADKRWPELAAADHDVSGQYLKLLVDSCLKRGLIRRRWNGGYRLTKDSLARVNGITAADA